MDRIREIQLKLLRELDDICRKNHLFYVICDNTMFYAYEQESISQIKGIPRVAMTIGDAERFGKIVGAGGRNRYFESRNNSPNYKPFSARYGDCGTTDYDFLEGKNRVNHGIEIEILFITKLNRRGLWGKFDSLLELAWEALVMQGVTHRTFLYWCCRGIADACRRFVGVRKFGRFYYNYRKKNKDISDISEMSKEQTLLIDKAKIPVSMLLDRGEIQIDGYRFMGCSEPERFLERYFGMKWRDHRFKSYHDKYDSQVVLTDIPFADIVPQLEKTCDADRLRENYLRMRYKHISVYRDRKLINKNWENFLRAVDLYYAKKNAGIDRK